MELPTARVHLLALVDPLKLSLNGVKGTVLQPAQFERELRAQLLQPRALAVVIEQVAVVSHENVVTLVVERHNLAAAELGVLWGGWGGHRDRRAGAQARQQARTCGKSEPSMRPTRWPRRVVKWFRITSGVWPVAEPCPAMPVAGVKLDSLKNAVGPAGRCDTMMLHPFDRVVGLRVAVGGGEAAWQRTRLASCSSR